MKGFGVQGALTSGGLKAARLFRPCKWSYAQGMKLRLFGVVVSILVSGAGFAERAGSLALSERFHELKTASGGGEVGWNSGPAVDRARVRFLKELAASRELDPDNGLFDLLEAWSHFMEAGLPYAMSGEIVEGGDVETIHGWTIGPDRAAVNRGLGAMRRAAAAPRIDLEPVADLGPDSTWIRQLAMSMEAETAVRLEAGDPAGAAALVDLVEGIEDRLGDGRFTLLQRISLTGLKLHQRVAIAVAKHGAESPEAAAARLDEEAWRADAKTAMLAASGRDRADQQMTDTPLHALLGRW